MKICALFAIAMLGCGGSASSSMGPGLPANVVIVNATSAAIDVKNLGGSGQYYVESWDHSFYNGPGGSVGPLIRLGHTDPASIGAGVSQTIRNPGGSSFRVLAYTGVAGTTTFVESSCYGNC